jgi:hypothetical protein
MIPSFAHIHTVWFIQLGELGGRIPHECLGFYSPHGLPLLGLGLRSLLIHASPVSFLPKNLATLPFVLWRSCGAIGSRIAIFAIDEAGGGCATVFGGRIQTLGFVLEGVWIVGLQRARQFPEWLLEERHSRGGDLGTRNLDAGKAV